MAEGHNIVQFDLYDMNILPCTACRGCQRDWEHPACVRKDDMPPIFDAVLSSDLIVLASPIYSWYCTSPMKAALDRLVYAMNKYYGDEWGPSLWAGKSAALITTCGYKPERGADLWEIGMKRYMKHSKLKYIGMLAERQRNYNETFMDDAKAARAREFARTCTSVVNSDHV